MEPCIVPGCADIKFAKALCRRHYDMGRREQRAADYRKRYLEDPDFREQGLIRKRLARAQDRADRQGVTIEYLLYREGRNPDTGLRKGAPKGDGTRRKPVPEPIKTTKVLESADPLYRSLLRTVI